MAPQATEHPTLKGPLEGRQPQIERVGDTTVSHSAAVGSIGVYIAAYDVTRRRRAGAGSGTARQTEHRRQLNVSAAGALSRAVLSGSRLGAG